MSSVASPSTVSSSTRLSPPPAATLEPVRFGEFLRDRHLITDEQWLAALAEHWSAPGRRKIGATLVAQGVLPPEVIEAEARVFHDDLDVVEVVASPAAPALGPVLVAAAPDPAVEAPRPPVTEATVEASPAARWDRDRADKATIPLPPRNSRARGGEDARPAHAARGARF